MKKTTKSAIIILTGLLASVNLFAQGINFIHDKGWKEILAQAKREHKIVFLDAYTSWCGPCKYLQKNVFTDSDVASYFNKTFVNAKFDMESDAGIPLSEQYKVTSYPTLLFIDGDGHVLHKSIGAMDPESFTALGHDAADPAKQFYTLKEKALQNKLSSEQLLNWLESASNLGDEDADEITGKFIAANPDYLKDKNSLKIVLDYGKLNEQQLQSLYKNKSSIGKMMDFSNEDLDEALLNKVRAYALDLTMKDEKIDLPKYELLVGKFNPDLAKFETQKLKIQYLFVKEEYSTCLDEFKQLITDKKYRLGVFTLASLTFDYAELITKMERETEFITLIKNYQVLPHEEKKSYYKDLSLLGIYMRTNDSENSDKLVASIIADPNTPESIKNKLKNQ